MTNCMVCGKYLDKGATGVCPECSRGETSLDSRPGVIPWNPKWNEPVEELLVDESTMCVFFSSCEDASVTCECEEYEPNYAYERRSKEP